MGRRKSQLDKEMQQQSSALLVTFQNPIEYWKKVNVLIGRLFRSFDFQSKLWFKLEVSDFESYF